MTNLHYLKKNHNGLALDNLLRNLINSPEKTKSQILSEWDVDRGNDWFINTRKELTEVYLDSNTEGENNE
ncbi:hypothetical protein HOV44_gp005 [Rheinheimera phage Barba5S]|jgi:hypothetical protein|uniref:Uncharacterized protein n=2 Tax=Barbavirus TaxID=2733095 RepID=A0A4P8NC83_9CAUD|nr:hypothetical protein HOV44_gp005 [Rheinheimera phage Barba5S]YP_009822741.1 hypothetical protein HOV45_gp005 [Rheinheimera phage Barba8S]QCQ59083.1 hypothetical protein Barba5S_gp005 [Rheinheimera phage Barba5S]QCQ59636.1 hypothetical protein Barba8S_gp005 [Rheinheimera phage Barba8S]